MSIEDQNRILRLETALILLTARIAALENGTIAAPPVYNVPRKGWPKGKPRGKRNGKTHIQGPQSSESIDVRPAGEPQIPDA